jgi:hypothetical protein
MLFRVLISVAQLISLFNCPLRVFLFVLSIAFLELAILLGVLMVFFLLGVLPNVVFPSVILLSVNVLNAMTNKSVFSG